MGRINSNKDTDPVRIWLVFTQEMSESRYLLAVVSPNSLKRSGNLVGWKWIKPFRLLISKNIPPHKVLYTLRKKDEMKYLEKRGVTCLVCGRGFTDDEWTDRHLLHKQGCAQISCDCDFPIHAQHCPKCDSDRAYLANKKASEAK